MKTYLSAIGSVVNLEYLGHFGRKMVDHQLHNHNQFTGRNSFVSGGDFYDGMMRMPITVETCMLTNGTNVLESQVKINLSVHQEIAFVNYFE